MKTSLKSQTDVVLFIRPDSPGTARIGLSYRTRIPHTQVQSEIRSLLSASGWKLRGEPSISDRSVRPKNPGQFPPTTGAMFSVADAPQFHDNAPILAPYLKAFQIWDHLEIMFVTTDLVPYNGVTNFHDPALDVTLVKSDGIYDYLVIIHEHARELPPLIPDKPDTVADKGGKQGSSTTTTQNLHDSGVATGLNGPSQFWPYLLIIVGCLLVGGVALYLLVKRHQENFKPGQTR